MVPGNHSGTSPKGDSKWGSYPPKKNTLNSNDLPTHDVSIIDFSVSKVPPHSSLLPKRVLNSEATEWLLESYVFVHGEVSGWRLIRAGVLDGLRPDWAGVPVRPAGAQDAVRVGGVGEFKGMSRIHRRRERLKSRAGGRV
ncbi:MAG: hypothetical protein LBT40_09380 [Deltaproteobacteria bacterium]|jgi:hypothetical protein|nr:hypothetical protein [Deltaproteobacteria bacterium]